MTFFFLWQPSTVTWLVAPAEAEGGKRRKKLSLEEIYKIKKKRKHKNLLIILSILESLDAE